MSKSPSFLHNSFFVELIGVFTRHDYLGRSSARDSFLIWTHHMKNITFHDSFTPTGATDSATYDNGSFQILLVESPIVPLTRNPRNASVYLRSRCPVA